MVNNNHLLYIYIVTTTIISKSLFPSFIYFIHKISRARAQTSVNYTGFVTGVNTLPWAYTEMAVGHNHNGTIYLVSGMKKRDTDTGGYESVNNVVAFENGSFTNLGSGFGVIGSLSGSSQFYTQLHQMIWMVDEFYAVIYKFDTESLNFNKHCDIPHLRRADGCLISLEWINDGYLIITGGENQDLNAANTVQILNLTTSEWKSTSVLNTNRYYHSCATHKGLIYVFGGLDNDHYPLDSIEIASWIDLISEIDSAWSFLGASLFAGFTSRAVVHLDDILVLGGNIQVLDTLTNTVRNGGNLKNGVDGSPGTIIMNGMLYVFGGSIAAVTYTNKYQYLLLPTATPTVDPTLEPTAEPTIELMLTSTTDPTVLPTLDPTIPPTIYPSLVPPTSDPTIPPTIDPPTTDENSDINQNALTFTVSVIILCICIWAVMLICGRTFKKKRQKLKVQQYLESKPEHLEHQQNDDINAQHKQHNQKPNPLINDFQISGDTKGENVMLDAMKNDKIALGIISTRKGSDSFGNNKETTISNLSVDESGGGIRKAIIHTKGEVVLEDGVAKQWVKCAECGSKSMSVTLDVDVDFVCRICRDLDNKAMNDEAEKMFNENNNDNERTSGCTANADIVKDDAILKVTEEGVNEQNENIINTMNNTQYL